MSRIAIVPIVEGHGETEAVPVLLRRIWTELLGGDYAEVLAPIRRSRGRLMGENLHDLARAVNLALLKLAEVPDRGLILVLVDAEDDCSRLGSLGPLLADRAARVRPDADIACVVANVMFETWFVGAADSLTEFLRLAPDEALPDDPEASRCGKTWIQRRFTGARYSETVDQPRLTARMDLSACRRRCRSFDKLCRELERRLAATGA